MRQKPIQLFHRKFGTNSSGEIRKVAWSPGGQLIASASWEGVILWNVATGEEVGAWSRIGAIRSIAWSPTARYLAVGTCVYRGLRRGMVRLWQCPTADSVERGVKNKPFCEDGDADPAPALSWSPDSTRLAVTLELRKVAIRDILSGDEVLRYQTDHGSTKDIAWSPDGASIASLGSVRQDQDYAGTVTIYNMASGKTTMMISSQTHFPHGVAWSPDSRRLMVADDKIAEIWECASSSVICTYKVQAERKPLTECLRAVAWSPDGQYIAIASDDWTVHVWEPGTGRTLSVFQTDAPASGWYSSHSSINSVAWSPNSQQVVAGDEVGRIHIWSL